MSFVLKVKVKFTKKNYWGKILHAGPKPTYS